MGNSQIVKKTSSWVESSYEGFANMACIPTKACIYGSNAQNQNLSGDPTLGPLENSQDRLFEIIQKQQLLLDRRETISDDQYEILMGNMAEYYGTKPEDIRFVEMELENAPPPENDNNSVLSSEISKQHLVIYKGFTIRGKKTGYGHLYYMNGELQSKGTWKNDKLHGEDIKVFYGENKPSYEGSMVGGMKEGGGREYYKNGKVMYDGGYLNDEWHGDIVKIYHFDGELEYDGRIYKGMRQGFGKAWHDNGTLNYSGNWKGDKPDGNYIVIWGEDGEVRYQGCAEDKYLNEY
jgi:antitoxin component YwqK of YwqJK toxin-antitoxin module